jgi:alkanesulfonate monooxygenase SsuD/methylene tetrahydromethanopterin reductase-like flavin-dependent oxidoreductase (luciferase family)
VAVNCIFYRSPALLARQATDVDRLSGGRLLVGLGIGNHEKEFAKVGVPFLPASERQEALAETIHIVEGLWGSTPFTYTGKYFQVRDANVRPGPVQQPHVPVLLAGVVTSLKASSSFTKGAENPKNKILKMIM